MKRKVEEMLREARYMRDLTRALEDKIYPFYVADVIRLEALLKTLDN